MACGDAHLGTGAAGPAEWTTGVVSPRRSSAAGLCTASNMKRRSCCLVHPAARNISACSGQITNTDGSSSGHQRSEEHTSELQSRPHLVCRLLLEKKKKQQKKVNILKTKKKKH